MWTPALRVVFLWATLTFPVISLPPPCEFLMFAVKKKCFRAMLHGLPFLLKAESDQRRSNYEGKRGKDNQTSN